MGQCCHHLDGNKVKEKCGEEDKDKVDVSVCVCGGGMVYKKPTHLQMVPLSH